jgi:hypothetical protein
MLLYGIVIVSPVAPITIFGVMSERHVIAAVLIAMVASLLTGLSY